MSRTILPDPEMLVFTTRDFAQRNDLSLSAASYRLTRLAEAGVVQNLSRGIWCQPRQKNFNRLAAIPYLLGTEHGYLSFLSALNHHEMIEQIPDSIFVATTGYPRKLKTPVGTFEFIKLSPRMMTSGLRWADARRSYLIAEPEKALLDTFYIATRKGRRFKSLPELDVTALQKKKFLHLLKEQIISPPLREAVLQRWKKSIL